MLRARAIGVLAALGLPAALATGSCHLVLDSFEKGPEVVKEVVVDAGPDGPEPCINATYPDPPPANTMAGEEFDFVVAVQEVDFGEDAPPEAPVGLDLDRTCSCDGEGASCKYPVWADESHCDDKNGVDNATGKLFKSMQSALGATSFGSAYYSKAACNGLWSLLMRVTGYNGEKNDDKVTFIIYTTPGYGDPMGAGGAGGGGGGGAGGAGGCGSMPAPGDPRWDGTDVWPVSSASLLDGVTLDMPKYVDVNAYVSDGTLVANVNDTQIDLDGLDGHFGVKLTAGTVLAPLSNPDGKWRIEKGIVAARWRWEDLFTALGSVKLNGQALCADNNIFYPPIQERLCAFVDIGSKIAGPTTECDAISFGMSFKALPAMLGAPYVVPAEVPQCAPGTEPINFACDKLQATD